MRMKSVPTVIAVISALGSVVLASPDSTAAPAGWWTTTGAYGQNLEGKMFTLSQNRGGISFYPPYFDSPNLWYSTPAYQGRKYTERSRFWAPTNRYYPSRFYPSRSYTTRPKPSYTPTPYPTGFDTSTSAYPTQPYSTSPTSWTTAPTTTGVSVCLRYLAEYWSTSLFTLSPSSRNPVTVKLDGLDSYRVIFDRYGYYSMLLKPNIVFWRTIGPELWTRLCLVVDSRKNVVQVFSGSKMSIRKMLPLQFVWSGEPVIPFSGFDGQLTDVQMWDYPVSYREVFRYMTKGIYRGSVLTWSSISYSMRGNTLLEDAYERQDKQAIGRKEKEHRLKGKKMKKFVKEEKHKEWKRQQLL